MNRKNVLQWLFIIGILLYIVLLNDKPAEELDSVEYWKKKVNKIETEKKFVKRWILETTLRFKRMTGNHETEFEYQTSKSALDYNTILKDIPEERKKYLSPESTAVHLVKAYKDSLEFYRVIIKTNRIVLDSIDIELANAKEKLTYYKKQ